MERYLRVNLLGPGPRRMKKEFTGPRSHKFEKHWTLDYMELYIHALNTPPRRAAQAQTQPSCLELFKHIQWLLPLHDRHRRSCRYSLGLNCCGLEWQHLADQTNKLCVLACTQHGCSFRFYIYNQELEQNVHCQKSNKRIQKSIRYQVCDNLLHLVQTCNWKKWTN